LARAIGWLIHPAVESRLPESPRIADVATGTGNFLLEAAKLYPKARLDGFDISDRMFPKSMPAGVHLHVHNAKDAFPIEFHGAYDLVHVRYILAGMMHDEWVPVLRNLMALLKPGGAIQWCEPNFVNRMLVRGETGLSPSALPRTMDIVMSGTVAERLNQGWNELPGLMRESGLIGVEADVVGCDRVPETRKAITAATWGPAIAYGRKLAKEKAPGALTLDEVEDLERQCVEEQDRGCYLVYFIHTAIGFKPKQ
jgi:SAM-dependent methyltransferase